MEASTEPNGGSVAARAPRRRVPLRAKALAAFVLVAVVPLAGTAWWLVEASDRVVRSNEARMQLVVVREVASDLERDVGRARADLEAVAVALSTATTAGDEAAQAAAEAVIQSRPGLVGVRLEVPAARLSTTLTKAGHDAAALPRATPTLLAAADRGITSIEAVDAKHAALAARIPGSGEGGRPAGYVVAPLWLDPITEDLARAAERNQIEGAGTRIVVVDEGGRGLASLGEARVAPGGAAVALPIWAMLAREAEHGAATTTSFGAAGTFTDEGEARFGTVHVLAPSGWRVAVSRPEALALADSTRLRRAAALGAGAAALLAIAVAAWAARLVTAPVLQIAGVARRLGARAWSSRTELPERNDELGELASSMREMAEELETSEQRIAREAKLRADLSRYLGQEVVDAVVSGERSLALGGVRAQVTVLFADVVGFTPMAERCAPEHSVALLNELFTLLGELVFRHGGIVDKFVGDSVMAVFGAPVAADDHADRAIAAAEEMQSFVETARDSWRERFGVEVALGIGINSGEVLAGNVGSEKRMEYTVIGDVVNVAARLEALAAPGQILVGEGTRRLSTQQDALRSVGTRTLGGRVEAVAVYEVPWAG